MCERERERRREKERGSVGRNISGKTLHLKFSNSLVDSVLSVLTFCLTAFLGQKKYIKSSIKWPGTNNLISIDVLRT